MITHSSFEVELEMGSFLIYSVWERPTKWHLVDEKRYYWHDKTCEESIGPFTEMFTAMEDYARVKLDEKRALQRRKKMQLLHKREQA